MKAIITVGIPTSGKTTFAKELIAKDGTYVNINRDDLRRCIKGDLDWRRYRFGRGDEELVTNLQISAIEAAAEAGRNVIISDTNLNEKIRNRLIRVLEGVGYEVEIKDFQITLKEAYARDAARPNGVGHEVIYSMYQRWLKYSGRKVYKETSGKPYAVIVDVDGTVAKMGDRSPFDWAAVGIDTPREEIISMVSGLTFNHTVIFLSGRDSVCRDETIAWLKKYVDRHMTEDRLFMRPEGSHEPDTVVKERLFWEHVAPHYNVTTAIDDRPCMVRLWLELGIKNVISVANPYIEF
jgi:predicted kinase